MAKIANHGNQVCTCKKQPNSFIFTEAVTEVDAQKIFSKSLQYFPESTNFSEIYLELATWKKGTCRIFA